MGWKGRCEGRNVNGGEGKYKKGWEGIGRYVMTGMGMEGGKGREETESK